MDSFIKFIGHSAFQSKRIKREGLTRGQWLAYKDFQSNFDSRIQAYEEQIQAPINKSLTKKELVNLYSAHYQNEFSPKQFADKTGINKNTARRELSNGVKRGLLERTKKGEYRYK